ncbi:MAG: metalloregulator ArsR/SmtB family transcription factor [Candidatus Neomarinimicrobiota bacterium]
MVTNKIDRSCKRSFVDHDTLVKLRRDIHNNSEIENSAEVFSMLGNTTRLKILYCLAKANELCVCDLSDVLKMEISAVSHQLRKLKDRGLLASRRDGLTIYYRLADLKLSEASDKIYNLVFPVEPLAHQQQVN